MKYTLFLFILLFLAGQVFTQEILMPEKYWGIVSSGVSLQLWNIEHSIVPITQLSMPVTIILPVGNQFNLTISHTPAFSKFGVREIGGFSDTWIQGTYMFWNERMVINAGLGVPTGKTRLKGAPEDPENPAYLDDNEFELSRWLSLNIFRFQLPIYGQGLCGMGGIMLAIPIHEKVVIGLGGQYLYRNPYHPLEYQYMVADIIKTSDEVYRPGDELSGHFGIDFQFIENTKIMLDGIYTYYWPDQLSDVKIYGAGQKITVNFGFLYQFDEKFISSQILYRYQGKNKLLQELDIELEDKNRNGSQLEINLTYKAVSITNFSVYLYGDGRIYNKNELNDLGKAFASGGGFGVDYQVSDNWILDFSFKYLGGSVTTNIEHRVEGMDVYFGFKYMF